MKRVIPKVITLCVATTMLFSSTVMAMPRNTVVIGDQAYSMDAIFGGVNGIQAALDKAGDKLYYDLEGSTDGFKGLFSGESMTQAQKDELNSIKYYDANGFKGTYAKFDDQTVVEDLKVTGIEVVNSTTIKVTFEKASVTTVETFTVDQLTEGTNTRTINYDGKDITVEIVVPVVNQASVESVNLINYREMKVTFNTVVDEASAEDAANYYFAIVEGNGEQTGYGANNVLKDALSFNEISDIDSQVVLSAETLNGKTVVTIHFPEDARFTYRLDKNTYRDAERVIIIEKANGEKVALEEGKTVAVAVRNVKDVNGKYTIDTKTFPIEVKDLVNPNLLFATKTMTNDQGNLYDVPGITLDGSVIDIENTTPEVMAALERGAYNPTAQFKLTFDEPVYDGHLNARNELENSEILSNVQVFINDTNVTKTQWRNFNKIIHFNMDEEDSYDAARDVTLDLYNAVATYSMVTYGDLLNFWNVGKTYDVKIKGVTDLAGNIQKSSTINFKIKLVEAPTISVHKDYVPPKVLDVVQIADNAFRVYFDQSVTNFKFTMEGSDGDAGALVGAFSGLVPTQEAEKKYYVDVYAPATDKDAESWPEWILSYNDQNFINVNVLIHDILNGNTTEAAAQAGESKKFPLTLVKDTDAPVANAPVIRDITNVVYYEDITKSAQIVIPVEDVEPFAVHVAPQDVDAVKYAFGISKFTDIVDANGDYLPVKVWYEDNNGKHEQTISNQSNLAENAGIFGAISYEGDKLVLDLNPGDDDNLANGVDAAFAQLLNDEGKLIEGETYTIEIPKGYFTDSARLDAYFGQYDSRVPTKLYVDNGRGAIFANTGFISEAMTLTFTVPVRKVPEPDHYYGVPQTTKELISYDDVNNRIQIEFTGDIDQNTLKNPANYLLDGVALPANTIIEYKVDQQGTIDELSDDRKFALITLPENTVAVDGFVEITIKDVANPDGGKMTPVTTKIELEDNTRPSLVSAVVSGESEIVLTYSEPLEYKAGQHSDTAAYNFKVFVNNKECTVSDASINTALSDVTKVTLTVNGTVIDGDDIVKVQVMKDTNGALNIEDRSQQQNPIREGTFDVSNPTK